MLKSNFLGALLVCVCGSALAETVKEAPTYTLGDLSRVNAERIYYTGVAARDEAKRKAESEAGVANGAPTTSSGLPSFPALRQIITVNGTTTGVFAYTGGIRVEKGVGEALPGGYTIVSLSPSKLSGEVKDKSGRLIPIGVSDSPIESTPSTQPQAGQFGMPPGIPPAIRVPAIVR